MPQYDVEMVTVDTPGKAAQHGFFCYKSKPKSDGYGGKLAWLEDRFAEGRQIRIVKEDGRSVGFIEYTPGEFAWRPVMAPGYLFVHCLWVVGRAKAKGYGSRLLEACVDDARAMGKHGVALLTKKGGYLVGRRLFLKHGFEALDRAPPTFDLMAFMLDHAAAPALPHDWDERAARYGQGLTIVYADQCPYSADAVAETRLSSSVWTRAMPSSCAVPRRSRIWRRPRMAPSASYTTGHCWLRRPLVQGS